MPELGCEQGGYENVKPQGKSSVHCIHCIQEAMLVTGFLHSTKIPIKYKGYSELTCLNEYIHLVWVEWEISYGSDFSS